MSKQTSDADKLLAVCRVVWPGKVVSVHWPPAVRVSNLERIQEGDVWYRPDKLDDLRRVLLALDKAQRSAFNHRFSLLMEQKKNGNICRPSPSRTLTAPTTQILDALHRAVCPE